MDAAAHSRSEKLASMLAKFTLSAWFVRRHDFGIEASQRAHAFALIARER